MIDEIMRDDELVPNGYWEKLLQEMKTWKSIEETDESEQEDIGAIHES